MADGRRNIILLSDGTGNSASNLFKTNVRRVYEALDLADPKHPMHPRQFAYYDDGVGTSSFRPLAILGGAFGLGLARNVRDLYAFLCRTYRPGDRIYAFGFSRGAFTVRVTIGMIVSQGIIAHDGDEATLARNVKAAYRAYRRERYGWRAPTLLGRAIRDALVWAWWRVRGFEAYTNVKRHHVSEEGEGTIEFVGVWDTVDAYGLPIEELTRAVDALVTPLTMPDAVLARQVKRARHALSLDDQRNTFHPRLWTEEHETDPNRIRQVWFAGVHADVGGGYPDDGLAHVTLRWMMDEAEAAAPGGAKLRFTDEVRERQRALADENGPLHDSRRGLASYYRYKPRRVSALASQPKSRARMFLEKSCERLVAWRAPSLDSQRTRPERRFKVEVPKPIVHESVLRRIQVGQDGYAPISLPPAFRVQLVEGGPSEIEPGAGHLWAADTPTATKGKFGRLQEHVWNFVWWRRVAYFITLGGTLYLALLPLGTKVEGCSSWACFATPAILALDYVLPGFASTWTQAFASNPASFLAGASVILFGTLLGQNLDVRIPDEMRRLWYRTKLTPERKATMAPLNGPRKRGRLNRGVQRLRTSRAYEVIWEVTRRAALPFLALFAASVLILGGVNAALLSARESWGGVCGSEKLTDKGGPFRTGSVCHQAADSLEPGATYKIRVTIPSANPGEPEPVEEGCEPKEPTQPGEWWDCSMPATPNGIRSGEEAWWMPSVVPFRRHVGEPWYKLMARIGTTGSDVYSPDWRQLPPAPDDNGSTFEALLRARRSGPLYVYVNDAALVIDVRRFYASNNRGTADIAVTLVDFGDPRLSP